MAAPIIDWCHLWQAEFAARFDQPVVLDARQSANPFLASSSSRSTSGCAKIRHGLLRAPLFAWASTR